MIFPMTEHAQRKTIINSKKSCLYYITLEHFRESYKIFLLLIEIFLTPTL